MRLFIIFTILLCSQLLLGQDSNSVFDNNVKLKDGIYTSFPEIIKNNPKYYEITLETKLEHLFGPMSIYYHDKLGIRHQFNDTILLIVEDGERYVQYNNWFYKLIQTGSISIFSIVTSSSMSTAYSNEVINLYYWDLQTGKKNNLNLKNLDEIIKRDSLLYSKYSGLSKSQKRKMLYYYVLRYNENSPIYLQHYE
jgi:hypothetical protein